jgi:hypothetical protein
MPAEFFPLAAALSGGRLGPEIAIAIVINVGGAIACAAGLRWALKDVPNVPESVTAWPWEPEAWGFPRKSQAAAADSKEGEEKSGEASEGAPPAAAAAPEQAPAAPQAVAPSRAKTE